MTVDRKIFWFLGISALILLLIIVGTAALIWQPLSPSERDSLISLLRQNIGYFFMAAVLLFAVAAFMFDAFIHLYLIPLRRAIEEMTLIRSVNPGHRLQIEGAGDINRLVAQVNEMAALVDQTRADAAIATEKACADLEDEKNVLAAIMTELPQGVAICNTHGVILLVNRQFKMLLAPDASADASGLPPEQYVGLGRSVYNLLDPHMVDHALDDVRAQVQQDPAASAVSSFVLTNTEARAIRVETAPILNPDRDVTGYVLILHDITEALAQDDRVGAMVDTLSRGIRGSLASIRSSIEAILNFPDMDVERLDLLRRIIHDESIALEGCLEKMSVDHASRLHTQWPLVPVPAGAFLDLLVERARTLLGLTVSVQHGPKSMLFNIDRYSFILSVLHLLNRVANHCTVKRFWVRLSTDIHRIHVEFTWRGRPVKIFHVRRWSAESVTVGDEHLGFPVQAVLSHHGVDVWPHGTVSADEVHLRFFLPLDAPAHTAALSGVHIDIAHRPEYYDFDLFDGERADAALYDKPLTDLTITVFDTETTGLDPAGGDEIVSIAGVRIVNGRLLLEDRFDQLVNPERDIPIESTRIHGISAEDVAHCPTIASVLPQFARFADGSVLMAHNAAFDMRMLQLAESRAGVAFDPPVLDTLLLSAAVHPSQRNQFMDAIAERLGIVIEHRHTALGDAMATARIFLHLIPLLADQGIVTLADAMAASKKVFLSRVKF